MAELEEEEELHDMSFLLGAPDAGEVRREQLSDKELHSRFKHLSIERAKNNVSYMGTQATVTRDFLEFRMNELIEAPEQDYNTLVKFLEVFMVCKLFERMLEEQLKALKTVREQMEADILPEMMDALGKQREEIHGQLFYRTSRTQYQIMNQAKAFKFIEQIGSGACIKLGVHPKTLNALLQEYEENNNAEVPEDVFNVHRKGVVRMKKAAQSSGGRR